MKKESVYIVMVEDVNSQDPAAHWIDSVYLNENKAIERCYTKQNNDRYNMYHIVKSELVK